MRFSKQVLVDHEPDFDLYEPFIQGCKGCDWEVSDLYGSIWEAYLAHIVQAEEPVLWVWSPEHGAQRWYGTTLPPDPTEDERRLAEALQKLAEDRGWVPNHIYFFATVTEVMG